jgi:hypothetical protein
MVVKEDFIKKLYSAPAATRSKPDITIWDELRHATQHSQKPLEQVIQLISEFHGPFSGINQNTANLLNVLLSLFSNKQNKNIQNTVKTALNTLKSFSQKSTIGRQNNITANDMSIPLYRAFIQKSQAIHPSVNTYIQNNIGKYPHFQQISENVGSLGQVVLTSKDIHPSKRIETGGKDSMTTDFPIRRGVERKLFKNISQEIDLSTSLVNCLLLRGLRPNGCAPILESDGITTKSHGYDYVMDTENAERNKKSVAPSLSLAIQRFGPTTQLLDNYFPVDYQVKLEPLYYEIQTETGSCLVDRLSRPITREVQTPVAKDEDVVQIA